MEPAHSRFISVASPYREIVPPSHLRATVECFWTMRQSRSDRPHRVTPDGCLDILFTLASGRPRLDLVGPMLAFRDFPAADQFLFGLRFRPGLAGAHLREPAGRITNLVLPLEDIWGADARRLADRLAEAASPEDSASLLAGSLQPDPPLSSLQKGIAWIESRRGCVSLDELATRTGLSHRHLRRVFQEQTGFTPKFLARILRFRHALSSLERRRAPLADLALECGYYDQAHFINDFRSFSGSTPAAYCDGRFFQSAPASPQLA